MSSKFSLDLNGTISLRTDKTFRDGDTKSTVHELAFDHVVLTFDNIDTLTDAFVEAAGKTFSQMMGEMPTIDAEVMLTEDGVSLDAEAVSHLAALKRARAIRGDRPGSVGFFSSEEYAAYLKVLNDAGLKTPMSRTDLEVAIRSIEQEGVVPASARKPIAC